MVRVEFDIKWMIMALVNYVNLSVARGARRFNEIAARKVSGPETLNIVSQFVTESIVTNGVSLPLSFRLIQIVRAPVGDLFDIYVITPTSLSSSSALIFVSVVLSGTVVTRLHPAFISMVQKSRKVFTNCSLASGGQLLPVSVLTQ